MDLTEEKIKLFDRLNIAWEFPKNGDLPIVILTYKDNDGNLWCLSGRHKDKGTINVGEAYRECFEEAEKLKKYRETNQSKSPKYLPKCPNITIENYLQYLTDNPFYKKGE